MGKPDQDTRTELVVRSFSVFILLKMKESGIGPFLFQPWNDYTLQWRPEDGRAAPKFVFYVVDKNARQWLLIVALYQLCRL